MRDIEGIESVVEQLRPHLPEIERRFNEENAKFLTLMQQPHDVIGRLLKCHLIVEHYLDRFLTEHFGIEELEGAKLGFFHKAMLLPSQSSSAAFVKPGILKLNSFRNRFGHDLSAKIDMGELGPIRDVLEVARANGEFPEPIDAIEAFTTVACTWLIVPSKEHQMLFAQVFSKVRINRS